MLGLWWLLLAIPLGCHIAFRLVQYRLFWDIVGVVIFLGGLK